ncbi:hypothetical protein WA158_004586 [Blastocystis sp. Blastoise]
MRNVWFILFSVGFFYFASAQCATPTVGFTATRNLKMYPAEERWSIYQGTDVSDSGVLIFTNPIVSDNDRGIKTYEVCLQTGAQYTLALWDGYGDGWSSGSTISISIGNHVFFTETLKNGEALKDVKKNIPFTLSLTVSPGSTWKTTIAPQVGNTWTQASFADTTWIPLAPGSFPTISTTTRYYRFTTTLTQTGFHAIGLSLKMNSGYIIYVNGQEASRAGLPIGSVDSNTASLSAENTATFKNLAIPASIYMTSGNSITFAIEVHSHSTQLNTADPFVFFSEIVNDNGLIVGGNGDTTCLYDSNANTETCDKGFDGNLETKFSFTGTENTITYSFPGGMQTWFNGYRIVSAGYFPERDMKAWKLYGSNDNGVTWLFLDSITGNSFPERTTSYNFYLPSNRKAFSQIKLVTTENNGNTYTEFYEFSLMAYSKPLLNAGLQYSSPTLIGKTSIDVSLAPISTGIHTYTVSPPFPTGIYLNPENGLIYGSTDLPQNNVAYTISAIDGATNASTSTVVTFNIVECAQPAMAFISLYKYEMGNAKDERIVIYSETNTEITTIQGVNFGAAQTKILCEPAGRWKFVLFDDNNDGWDTGSRFDVSIKYNSNTLLRIARLYLLEGTTATYYINTRLDVGPRSGWKYQLGAPTDVNWKTALFSDAAWQTLTYIPSISVTQNIVLLRRTFTIMSKTNMVGWEIDFKSKAGCVIYVNGNEVYRYYISAGEVNSATVATGGENSFLWRSVSGPMTTLSNGNSVTIAIALVNLGTTSYNLEFDGLFRLLGDANVIQNAADGNYDSSGVFSDGNPEYLFDSVPKSRWISDEHDSVTEKWVTVEFNNKRAIYMNKYCLISNRDSPQHDPADWTIYGSMDGTTWTSITSQSNVSWEERKQRQCFFALGTTQAYTNYKISITKATEILPQNKYAFAELEFLMIDAASIVIPPFTFNPTNLVAYKGGIIPALLVSSEYYHDFSISPALPAGISMDTSNGYFNGIATQLQNPTTYRISAKNIQGVPVTADITFSVVTCAYPNSLFSLQFTFYSYANEASWVLKDSAGTTVDSRSMSINYSTQTFTFCRSVGIYSLTLADSANDGWGDGTYTVLLEDGTIISTGTVPYNQSPRVVSLNIGRVINLETSNWKYFISGSAAPSGWNTASFSDATWTSGIASTLPAPTGTTQYYRTTFTISTIDPAFAGLDIGAKTYAGMIIYLNGQEIRRVNMPTGTVSYNTAATKEFSEAKLYSGSLSLIGSTILTTGTNVIAVEIHKKDTLPTINIFDGFAGFIATGEYRVLDGIPSSDITVTGTEGIEKLFDDNIATKTTSGPRCVGAIFQWTYSEGRREYINHYKVSNANDCNKRTPSAWRLEGSNDGNTWTLLHFVRNQIFSSHRYTLSYDFYAAQAYNMIRMVVTECENINLVNEQCGDSLVQLSELGFYITNKAPSCAAEGTWSPAPEGGYSFQECATGYYGVKRRFCSGGVLSDILDLCSLIAPSGLSYPGTPFTFHKRIPVNISPAITGAELSFSSQPILPAGLTLNSITGAITGTPSSNSPLTTYTITATNTAGSITSPIIIQIDTASCTTDNGWPTTEAGLQATLPCTDTINYEGSRTRSCQVSYPAVWGSVVDGCQLKMPTIIYSTTTITGHKSDAITPVVATITGGSLNPLTIAPTLPTGLSFNAQNGQISGTPISASSGTYTITASNGRGQATATITINISVVNCPLDGIWAATERATTAYVVCPTGQLGVQSRVCQNTGVGTAVWQVADSSNCFTYDAKENPGDNKIFINVPIKLEGLTETAFKTASTTEIFRTIIVQSLTTYSIPSSAVKIISVSSVSTYAGGVVANIRITANDSDKERIMKDMNTYCSGANSALLSACRYSFDNNLKSVTATSLSGEITTKGNSLSTGIIILIVVLVILVVAIVAVVVFCVVNRSKGKKGKNGKKLGSSKKSSDKTKGASTSTAKPKI